MSTLRAGGGNTRAEEFHLGGHIRYSTEEVSCEVEQEVFTADGASFGEAPCPFEGEVEVEGGSTGRYSYFYRWDCPLCGASHEVEGSDV